MSLKSILTFKTVVTLLDLSIPTNSTLDVKSLYLNIPHKDGIQAVLNRLYHQNPLSEEVPLPPNTMADLLGIVLKQNFFQFSDFVSYNDFRVLANLAATIERLVNLLL